LLAAYQDRPAAKEALIIRKIPFEADQLMVAERATGCNSFKFSKVDYIGCKHPSKTGPFGSHKTVVVLVAFLAGTYACALHYVCDPG
jgi:hypothetical protein